MKQRRIPAVYMRGGTSKGLFFLAEDLPSDPAQRDRLLLRAIGSPDPFGKQIDGLGGATSSTSKVAIISRSARADCEVDYLFGQVAIDAPMIDWSGNCGNLTGAVGPFAIGAGLLAAPTEGVATVRIWQANIARKIVAHVPMCRGEVEEGGEFRLDGVAFPAAEVKLEFLDPAGEDGESGAGAGAGATFPTGQAIDRLEVPGHGSIEATLINAGNPTIFVDAFALGLAGTELQRDLAGRSDLFDLVEAVRSIGAVAMGLAATPEEATAKRPHTPKVAVVARPSRYTASDGRCIEATAIDLLARIFSMGQLHHAMTGTGAVALAAAAAIPGTIVHRVARRCAEGTLRFGHPSGTLTTGAVAEHRDGRWTIRKVIVSRSARRLMEGWVCVPET
ncbi:MAG: 2-methylaconitate cis-trans isomerase PrpF [Gammaproteobacteria bacterium]|nr:2-methylaconitate cis-trans isomerase PrpF [Gammaproteobacteria bacterium]